jgi:hypothetical protein
MNDEQLQAPPPDVFVMFEAGKPDLFGARYTRKELEEDILPRVKAKAYVAEAWMEGDRLIVRKLRHRQ